MVLIAIGASGIAARSFYKTQYLSLLEGQLKDSLTLLSRQLPERFDARWCESAGRDTSLQIGVFTGDGTPVCEIPSLDLSALRKGTEVLQAQATGFGSGVRKGRDGKEVYFAALKPPARGMILVTAVALSDFYLTVGVIDSSLGVMLALMALLLGGFAVWSGQKMVFPLGRLLLKTQRVITHSPETFTHEEVAVDSYGEWSELESNIDHIRRDLEAKARTLDAERVELTTIMGSISDAILAVDPEGKPLFYNSRFKVLFGGDWISQQDVKLWELFRDPEVLEVFSAALTEGKIGTTSTISIDQQEGGRRYFSLSVSPLRQEGRVYGAVGIFHDVSELKTAEQMRIDFVANVSHELRTPLTSIKGYAETLIDDLAHGRPASQDFLATIVRNSNRLMNLMEDLLDLSSIESDNILQKDQLATEEITARVLKQLQPQFAQKKQEVSSQFDCAKVFADPERLEQVLVNLLSNANKYTPEGGKISVVWGLEGDDTILKVSDSGPGIALEAQTRVFERFYRVDKARSREQGGTGLGLAIVKHIMQRHEGSVGLESKAGVGSTFICRFPDLLKSK